MYRFAVDPGGTTGLFGTHFGHGVTWSGDDAHAMQAAPLQVVSYLDRLLEAGNVEWVACERFQQTPHTRTAQYEALEVIGALRYLCHRYRVPFHLQGRADRFRVSVTALRELDWWTVGKPHAQDAARHLYVGCVRHDPAFAEATSKL